MGNNKIKTDEDSLKETTLPLTEVKKQLQTDKQVLTDALGHFALEWMGCTERGQATTHQESGRLAIVHHHTNYAIRQNILQ